MVSIKNARVWCKKEEQVVAWFWGCYGWVWLRARVGKVFSKQETTTGNEVSVMLETEHEQDTYCSPMVTNL